MKDKKRILFMIPSLATGGAEKVLVNLVNNMDADKFQITVLTLFDGGINRQFLKPWIKYRTCFLHAIRGNSHLLKMASPERLYRRFIKEKYDILVSFLEGPTARVISGCTDSDAKLVSWIHVEQHNIKKLAQAFRSEKEARNCYDRFDRTVCVSQFVHDDFCEILNFKKSCSVFYNTIESKKVREQSLEDAPEVLNEEKIKLVAVGTLKESKGYERLLRIVKKLVEEGFGIHLYILGVGPLETKMKSYVDDNKLTDSVSLLGYETNPYRIVSKCDLFVCASYSEGFSTAATEALIVGTPVCTVEVSGMKEMLGEDNEYGLVTENNDDALFYGIRQLVTNPELLCHYKKMALLRGRTFNTEETVSAVEKMLLEL